MEWAAGRSKVIHFPIIKKICSQYDTVKYEDATLFRVPHLQENLQSRESMQTKKLQFLGRLEQHGL